MLTCETQEDPFLYLFSGWVGFQSVSNYMGDQSLKMDTVSAGTVG